MFLIMAEIPAEERGSSFHHASFHSEDYLELFANDGFKHFNAFIDSLYGTSEASIQ